MTDLALAVWAAGIAAWAAFVAYVLWISRQVWTDRLLPCPETGSIASVAVECVSLRAGSPPQPVVRHCGLWPARAGCRQGCLAHYEESVPGYLLNLNTLRPSDRV